jgi:PKD repeat protein
MLGTACGDGGGTPPPDNHAPVAGFSEVCTLLSCVFTDASTDADGAADIDSRSWSFGDGNTNTTDANPTHDYTTEGTKTVTLTVRDKAGASDVFEKDVMVSAAANNLPTADFSPNCSGLGCSFTDNSSDPDGNATIVAWSWTFDDGGTSNIKNPDHEYLVAGTYDVVLEVTDNRGGKGIQTKPVTVGTAAGSPPTAAFFPACTGFTCAFDDNSTDLDGTIASRSWDFGDGSPLSTEENPSHTYLTAKHYNVTLTVTDNAGNTGSKSVTVTISAPVPVTLTLPARSRLVFTLSERGCTSPRNAFMITAPVTDTLFKDGCRVPDATQLPFAYPSKGPFAAGDVTVQFVSGSSHQELSPKVTVTGGYPDWSLSFDDGEDSPADMDLVVTVHASAP